MTPLLGYWDVRGYAEPIRFLLHHVGADFEEKVYEVKTPRKNEVDRSEWLNEKYTLGLPFANLPYFIDGNVRLTQSLAILRYLGRKHGLVASEEEERQALDVLEQQTRDLLCNLITLCYSSDYEEKKIEYLKTLPEKLKSLEDWLCGRSWCVGSRITYVDFLAYEALDHHRIFQPTCLDQFPKLKDFMKRFEELPNIKKYMNSGRFKKWPLYGPLTKWGFHK